MDYMRAKETEKKDIEAKISGMGDYVKMDYLRSCLDNKLDFDTKKFVLNKLAEMYEKKGMYGDCAKIYRKSADINTTYKGKMEDFMQAGRFFVKEGDFENADISFNKAMACGNETEKFSIKNKIKEIYLGQAEEYMKKGKRRQAMDSYERILEVCKVDEVEQELIKEKLLELYKKLGKIKKYSLLKEK